MKTFPQHAVFKEFYNIKEAFNLFKNACDKKNHGKSCTHVAQMYFRGANGIEKDFNKALEWALKGCEEKKDTQSCMMLYEMYRRGHGVEKNIPTAKEYKQKAEQYRLQTATEEPAEPHPTKSWCFLCD